MGEGFSSKLSPWLSNGCLSVRYLYHKVREYANKMDISDEEKKSLDHFIMHLYVRDWYRVYALNWGNKIFFAGGIKDEDSKW